MSKTYVFNVGDGTFSECKLLSAHGPRVLISVSGIERNVRRQLVAKDLEYIARLQAAWVRAQEVKH